MIHQWVILIWCIDDTQFAMFKYQPCPSTSKIIERRLSKLLLERINRTKLFSYYLFERLRHSLPSRCHTRPKKCVIPVSSTMIFDRSLFILWQKHDRLQQFVQSCFFPLSTSYCCVEFVDVCLMMFTIMYLHGLCIDVRFKRIVCIRKRSEGMYHNMFRKYKSHKGKCTDSPHPCKVFCLVMIIDKHKNY